MPKVTIRRWPSSTIAPKGRRVDNVEGMLPRRVQTELAPSAQLAEPDRGKGTGKGVISYVDAIEAVIAVPKPTRLTLSFPA